MHWYQALIFGIVEGLTEFLPVSSTGHLILTARLLGLEQTDFIKTFEIAIQLGAILAVVVMYWRSLFVDRAAALRVLVAFIPTAVIGFVLYKFIKQYLLSSEEVVLWSMLIGGILLVLFDRFHRERPGALEDIAHAPLLSAFWVGVIQALAVIPGVSRSAATILGGLALGFHRKAIVEFSFLLAVPTIFAATALDVIKNREALAASDLNMLLLGGGVSFVVAILAIKLFIRFVQKHSLAWFGVYRIVAALLFWIFVK